MRRGIGYASLLVPVETNLNCLAIFADDESMYCLPGGRQGDMDGYFSS
jgi:hypothetical protein